MMNGKQILKNIIITIYQNLRQVSPSLYYFILYYWAARQMGNLAKQRDELFNKLISGSTNKKCLQIGVKEDIVGEAAQFSVKLKDQLSEDKSSLVVVVDDNSYYRSMRYAFHQLARDAGAGFCQFHILASLQAAIKANQGREESERVP